MTTLLERINNLPARYIVYKPLLINIITTNRFTTKAQLNAALKQMARAYKSEIEQLSERAKNTRIHAHLTQCHTLTQKCHDLARTQL